MNINNKYFYFTDTRNSTDVRTYKKGNCARLWKPNLFRHLIFETLEVCIMLAAWLSIHKWTSVVSEVTVSINYLHQTNPPKFHLINIPNFPTLITLKKRIIQCCGNEKQETYFPSLIIHNVLAFFYIPIWQHPCIKCPF